MLRKRAPYVYGKQPPLRLVLSTAAPTFAALRVSTCRPRRSTRVWRSSRRNSSSSPTISRHAEHLLPHLQAEGT